MEVYVTKPINRSCIDTLLIGVLVLATACGSSTNSTRENDGGKNATADSSRNGEDEERPVCIRSLLTTDVKNARDIGNWPLAEDKYVICRRIMRGGTLVSLSEAGCAEFAELGIRTVIDVRETSSQTSSPPPTCVTDVAAQVLAPMPKILPDTPENYLALMDQGEAVRKVFDTLGSAESYPVYIHCEIGRDRTNFIVALILLALGADKETIIEEFELSEAADVPVKPECIEAVLNEVEHCGGINSVLQSFGVSETTIEVLRAQLISE
jgi:hypothetical protein